MSGSRRNIDILQKIIKYCDEIKEANNCFGNSLERLKSEATYKNAVAMCILQIGELTGHLSDDFKKTYNTIPWRSIKDMRNLAAHRYGDFDINTLWETITDDIPVLLDYCNEIVQGYEIMTQDCIEEPDEVIDEEQGQGMKME